MKQYPKLNEDVSRRPSDLIISKMGSIDGSLDDLVIRLRNFNKESNRIIFDILVKYAWLEQHFTFNGVRRTKRSGNGVTIDTAFSFFMKGIVGMSQKIFTDGITQMAVYSYIKDFFPNFMDHDPFEEPEYFEYPYKHVTLDHLRFVYQCHNRLEMLKEAEDRKMNVKDFSDWAANWALCYNDDYPGSYAISRSSYIPYIKKLK